jgi:hypothetical protein
MYRLSAGAFILICLATILATGQQDSTSTLPQAAPPTTEIPGLPGFRVEEALNSSGDIRQLLLYRDVEQIQTLDVCTAKSVPRTGELGDIAVADFNFDGSPDLAILISSVNDNRTYCVWLFTPQTQRFTFSEELSRLTNPSPDPSTKTIVTYKSENCAGCYEREKYVWSGRKLIPVQHETLNDDPVLPLTEDCRFVRTLTQKKNGRMVEVARERVNGAGMRCEPHPGR